MTTLKDVKEFLNENQEKLKKLKAFYENSLPNNLSEQMLLLENQIILISQ